MKTEDGSESLVDSTELPEESVRELIASHLDNLIPAASQNRATH